MKKQRVKILWGYLILVLSVEIIALIILEKDNSLSEKSHNNATNSIIYLNPDPNLYTDTEHTLNSDTDYNPTDVNDIIAAFAAEHNIQITEYPDELIELLNTNPDTIDFVLNYPLKKDIIPVINLDEYSGCNSVPLFYQWDERWGYSYYGDEMMGFSGCGPTCLSMVCVYLFNDTDYNPRYIADFSEANGYCTPKNGSTWTLICDGGRQLGLDVTEIPLDEYKIIENLEAGNPIICVMGPGDFTDTGHYIVMTDYVDGQIKINDPNSKTNSEKLWSYEDINMQILNLWVCQKY